MPSESYAPKAHLSAAGGGHHPPFSTLQDEEVIGKPRLQESEIPEKVVQGRFPDVPNTPFGHGVSRRRPRDKLVPATDQGNQYPSDGKRKILVERVR